MNFASLRAFLAEGAAVLAKGPIALVFVEDTVEFASTVTHHAKIGFREIVVLHPAEIAPPPEVAAAAHCR